jgi:hypothetical protein
LNVSEACAKRKRLDKYTILRYRGEEQLVRWLGMSNYQPGPAEGSYYASEFVPTITYAYSGSAYARG